MSEYSANDSMTYVIPLGSLLIKHIDRIAKKLHCSIQITVIAIDISLVEEVCIICYKFLDTIYDKKRMKNVREIIGEGAAADGGKACKSLYHKKLTDSFRSAF